MPPGARAGKIAAALLAFSLQLAGCAVERTGGEAPTPGLAPLDAVFRAWMERSGVAEASLAVGHADRLVGAFGYGGRDAGERVLVASLSKAITGLCLGTLVDDGRLGFDTRVDVALAGFFAREGQPADPRLGGATLGQMLAHRGGFDRDAAPDAVTGPTLQRYLRAHRASDESGDALLAATLEATLPRAPGSAFRYANAPYLLLGVAIAEADGRPYAEACRARVLAPLGIADAALDPDWAVLSSFGGWKLSAPEYLAFLRGFDADSPVLGPKARDFLLDANGKDVPGGRGAHYALGVLARVQPGGATVWHSGRWRWRNAGFGDGPPSTDVGAYFVRLANGDAFVATYSPLPSESATRELDRDLVAALRAVARWPEDDLYARYGVGPVTRRGSAAAGPRSGP